MWRAAASAMSSGRVLKAIAALGAGLWTMFTTVSNSTKLFGVRVLPIEALADATIDALFPKKHRARAALKVV
jgi:hypothetical protein